MYIYMCRVVSDDRPRRTTACVRYGEPIERAFVFFVTDAWVGAVRIDSTGVSCVNVWNHCVYTSSSTPIARMHSCVRVPGHGTMGMDGWMACVHSCRLSSTREETDGFERRTERDHRHRSHRTRLSRVSLALALSLSNDEFIHSFIHSFTHSFRCERTNERRDERTNERPDALERDARETDSIDAFVRIQ